MPKFAPLIKVTNCRSFGAEVIFGGDTFNDSYRQAKALALSSNRTFVPGFDDPEIIAGAGTMGLEIIADHPDADAVIVPVGGGGLLAGVATAIRGLKPACRIIGVEPRHASTLYASLAAGKVTSVATPNPGRRACRRGTWSRVFRANSLADGRIGDGR